MARAVTAMERADGAALYVPLGWIRPRRLLVTLDSSIAAATLLAALFILPLRVPAATARLSHLLLMTAMGLATLLLMMRDGQYSSASRMSRMTDSLAVARNLAVAFLVAAGLALATKGFFTGFVNYWRLAVVGYLGATAALMVAARFGLWRYQARLFQSGENLRRLLIIGTGPAAAEFDRFLSLRPWLGVRSAGNVALAAEGPSTAPSAELALLGTVEEIDGLIEEHRAEEVVIALDHGDEAELAELTAALRSTGVPFRIVPSLFEGSYRSAKLAGFQALPVVDMEVDPLDQVQRTAKRALDLVTAAAALVLCLPLLALIALLIKLTSPGPVIFSQERVGRNGRHFRMYKFRTMHRDAEERLGDLRPRNEAQGHIFKLKDDPRITSIGRFLRRTSLDEFPQFVNVIRGEMSVVGPRPPIPSEVECYETQHHCRLKGLPGITGLWQVSGRSELTFDEMVKLDRYYLENWSIWLDLSIMLKTVYVVVARKGAY